MKFIDNESFENNRKTYTRYDWPAIACELKTRPTMWGDVSSGQKSCGGVRTLVKGALSRFGVFEYATRKQEDGTYTLYARFIREHGA